MHFLDPPSLFLYFLDLNEGDFLKLKKEQSLLVDFRSFPLKLIELLDLSINVEQQAKMEGTPK